MVVVQTTREKRRVGADRVSDCSGWGFGLACTHNLVWSIITLSLSNHVEVSFVRPIIRYPLFQHCLAYVALACSALSLSLSLSPLLLLQFQGAHKNLDIPSSMQHVVTYLAHYTCNCGSTHSCNQRGHLAGSEYLSILESCVLFFFFFSHRGTHRPSPV